MGNRDDGLDFWRGLGWALGFEAVAFGLIWAVIKLV